MDDEAELAFVLGHETGHIAAVTRRPRRSAAARNSILSVHWRDHRLVAVGGKAFGNLLSQTRNCATLSCRAIGVLGGHLRDALFCAAGYDPLGGANILASLGRADALQLRIQGNATVLPPNGRALIPTPKPLQRERQLAMQRRPRGQGVRNRDVFLSPD